MKDPFDTTEDNDEVGVPGVDPDAPPPIEGEAPPIPPVNPTPDPDPAPEPEPGPPGTNPPGEAP